MPLSPSPSPALGGERGERIGQEARHSPGKHQPTSHQRAWTTIPPNHLLLLIGELSSLSFSRPARCSTEDKAGVTLACSRSEPATPGLGVGGAPANCHIVNACVSVSRLRRPCRRRRCDCEAMAAVLERAGAWHGNGTVAADRRSRCGRSGQRRRHLVLSEVS